MLTIKKLVESNKQFILYGIIGAFSATIDFIVYMLVLNIAGVNWILVANGIGVLCGIITSFYLNRKYNFKTTDYTLLRFISFLSVGLVGLAISTSLIYLLVDEYSFNKIYSKIITIFIVAVFQFVINKFITFKSKK